MTAARERIVVAMSGGVDSSVAAALLLEQGFEPIGATLQLRPCEEATRSRSCCSADGATSARQAAGALGLAHFVLDRAALFAQLVLRPTWDEYARGRTPNPCVWCNERIKFGALLEFAHAIGASKVATGHYARLTPDGDGPPRLCRGADAHKDQSYFLFSLTAQQRAAAIFPLGDLAKPEVRELARQRGLAAADKAESQDACFLAEGASFAETLRRRFDAPAHAGEIVGPDGQAVGRHAGVHLFTIGQRQGLGVALGRPAWVTDIDAATGNVRLAVDADRLLARAMIVGDFRWAEPPRPMPCAVQIRYRHPAAPAEIEPLGNGRVRVRFGAPQRAITPGQAAVCYDGERVIGGGWIESAVAE